MTHRFLYFTRHKMKKINNLGIYPTQGEEHIGTLYGALTSVDVADHKQAIIYYLSGVPDIDNFFKPQDYIDNGFVVEVRFHDKAMVIYFIKYRGSQLVDIANVTIYNKYILDYDMEKHRSLKFVKFERGKHMAKSLGRSIFGVLGSSIGVLTEGMQSVNTILLEGVIFNLYYENKSGEKDKIQLYCPADLKDINKEMLDIFYRPEIDDIYKEELKL